MTYEQIRQRANQVRSIPLEAVLEKVGAARDPYDKAKWHTSEGTLSVTGMKFMNWNQAGGGGGAIDLVMHLRQSGFKAALQWLWDRFPVTTAQESPQPPPEPELRLPARDDSKLTRVKRYLVQQRSVPHWLIEPLIESGVIYADGRANAVFLLLGKGNQPVGAELRGTTHIPWRSMATGSRKDLGYFSIHPSDATTIILCESAIDALSCLALHPDSFCISTSGVRSKPRWLSSIIAQRYRVYCGFDSEPTGERMAQAMISLHPNIRRIRPAKHDWNDVLRSRRSFSLPRPSK